ncbi:MAG: tyrosine--tRNA ligase [Candidatus Omnitrophica bacterium]|nr:tyrosine--tRNA ligase [Candidatus Omnitrophota bacterium]
MSLKKKIAEQLTSLKRNVVEIISEEDLAAKIENSFRTNIPLRVKAGFDPTAPDIHLGHIVLLKKLRRFQDLGHIVYFIVGDFTARIGDPSGKNETRPPLTKKQIMQNAKTYTDQAFKILDRKKTKVVFNSKWFDKTTLEDLMVLLSNYTVARLLERDDFTLRMREGKPITMLEFLYPLMQGYDSVKIEADIELGGTDQKFNLIVGRRIQEAFGQSPQVIMTLPLLVGLDGVNKMSKSLGNYIGIQEKPSDIFGKTMSVSDELMYQYLEIFDLMSLKKEHPKETKTNLACEFVAWFYGKDVAKEEKNKFETIFSKKDLSASDFPEYSINSEGERLLDILIASGLVASKNEARRLIKQKALEFSGHKILDENSLINKEGILRVGKKKFLKIVSK